MKATAPEQEAVLDTEVVDGPVCQHHWIIDSPAGPVSKGVCRVCDEEREFLNYVEGSSWGSDISLEQLSGGSRYPAGVKVAADGGANSDEDA